MTTTFDRSVDAMRVNVRSTIRHMKRSGTTGCSFACLKQNTPTTGMAGSRDEYERAFAIAAKEEAGKARFDIWV